MAQQTVHRSLGNAVLSTAVRAAHSLRPRLGQDLRARIAAWANEDAAPAAPSPCAAEAQAVAAGSAAQAPAPVPVPAAREKPCSCVGIWDCSADCEERQGRRLAAAAARQGLALA